MSRARLTSTAGYALALVALTNTMSLLDRNILAILAPRIKHDIGVGDAEMGLLYGTVFALFYALFSLPLGRLADGWVRTRLLGITLAFWSVATALAAAAHGFALLALSRLGVGIGEGAAQPAGISLVMDHYAKPRRGFAMAVIAAAIALGLGGSSVLGGVAADWWDHLHAGGPRRSGSGAGSSRFSSPRRRASSWRHSSGACPSHGAGGWMVSSHRPIRIPFARASRCSAQ